MRKEEVKLSLFTHCVMIYVENPDIPQKKYKYIQLERITYVLYINNEQSEKEIKETIYNSIKTNKMLKKNINQKVNNLYTENNKTFLKEIKRAPTNRNIYCDYQSVLINKVNTVEMSISSKMFYRFNRILIKTPMINDRSIHPKIHMECLGIPNSQNIPEKKSWRTHIS